LQRVYFEILYVFVLCALSELEIDINFIKKKTPAAFIIKKTIESFLACLAEDVGVCLFDGI
jgi:hypothetical protein